MPARPTSQWVKIDRLVPHPENANEMTPEMMAKLRQNIDETGNVPPVIVRSLENSVEYTDLFEHDKLQILDGEHRWKDRVDAGAKEIEVRIWPNISDEKAKILLLTLNRLQGKDNRAKRNKLIRDLAELVEGDPDELAAVLPETIENITAMVNESTQVAVENAKKAAESISQQEPLTIFVGPAQGEEIRAAIKLWLDNNDHDRLITTCREGAALSAICGHYRDSS